MSGTGLIGAIADLQMRSVPFHPQAFIASLLLVGALSALLTS